MANLRWFLLALSLVGCDVYRDELVGTTKCAQKLCLGETRCMQMDADNVACMPTCETSLECGTAFICCDTPNGGVCGVEGSCEPVAE